MCIDWCVLRILVIRDLWEWTVERIGERFKKLE